MSDITELIDKVKEDCLKGIVQPKETMIRLLDIPTDTPEYDYLCRCAFEAAQIITGK